MKRLLIFFLAAAVLLCAGCARNTDAKRIDYIGKQLGLRLENERLVSFEDSHGGFNGDGTLAAVVACGADCLVFSGENHWQSLPLSEKLSELAYEYNFENANGDPVFPRVENGLYFFKDRYSGLGESQRYSDENVLSRYSFNFTLAVYDEDSGMIYYLEADT